MQRRCNCLENAFDVLVYLIVPKAKHTIAMIEQPSITGGIMLVIRMLSAIYFDYEALLATNEIHDVSPDRFLAYELEAAKTPGPQSIP